MPTVAEPSFADPYRPIGKLKIGDGEVHVWYGSYNDMQPYLSLISHMLSRTEQMRAEKYHFPIDRDRYLVRHGVLRILTGLYLSIDPMQIRFGMNQYGKPVIQNTCRGDPLQFNISYSNEMVLFAFTRGRLIGVDIEFIKSIPDMDAIVESCFSSNENAEFNALPIKKRQEAFYHCWTQKEAFVKAIGDGLSRSLDHFDVSLTLGTDAELRRTAWDQYEAARWSLKTITLVPGYIASLAVEGSGWSLSCRQLTPDNCMLQCAMEAKRYVDSNDH